MYDLALQENHIKQNRIIIFQTLQIYNHKLKSNKTHFISNIPNTNSKYVFIIMFKPHSFYTESTSGGEKDKRGS